MPPRPRPNIAAAYRPMLLALALLAGCVSDLPPDGTPYFARHTPGGLLFADRSVTYYADGTFLLVVSAFPDGAGRDERSVGPAPGAYEAALAALEAPTAAETAAERERLSPGLAEPHAEPSEVCTHFDGTQSRNVPLYACARAAAATSTSASS